MILYPNCKLNIGLRIVRKRPDGYHDLETIFYPVPLCDELEVIPLPLANEESVLGKGCPEDGIGAFDCEGIAIDCPIEDNLIYKCYRLMKEHFPQIGPVSVRFRKHIPFGAGLGGGSSDATHMAIALNELFHLGLSREQIAALVRPLGADCPFFAYNTPCFAEGIGDILTPIDFSLAGKRLVMIKPDVHVSTKEAYSGVTPDPNSNLRECISLAPRWMEKRPEWSFRRDEGATEWRERGFCNDFEKSVFPLHPELPAIKKRLLDAGAVYAAMSGSGSTIFGIFENDTQGGADTGLRLIEQEFASMIIFNDTLA